MPENQHTVAWTHDKLAAPGVANTSSEHLQGLLQTLMGHPDVDVIGIDGETWAQRRGNTWVVRESHPIERCELRDGTTPLPG